MPRLGGKAAIVTGGSHGIGAATCKALAREGAAVAVTDVLDDDGRTIAEHINSTGGNARFWHLDVTDEAAVEHVLGEVANAFGKIDVVVNNAGIAGVSKPTHEITIEEWEHVLKINVAASSCAQSTPYRICAAQVAAASSISRRFMALSVRRITRPSTLPRV